jgi:hypothetical protein
MLAVDFIIWKDDISPNGRTGIKKLIHVSWNLFREPFLAYVVFIRVRYGIAAKIEFSEI